MLLDGLIFVIGLGILYYGAEWLIKGAASLALTYGIKPLVVGLTVVALGTSMPEFLVNLFAAITNEDSLAVGNIVGSNICNVGLILGSSAVVLPLIVAPAMLRKEYPIMMGIMVLFYLLAMDGVVNRVDGFFLIVGLFTFLIFVVLDARRHRGTPEEITSFETDTSRRAKLLKILHLVGGIILLAVGARLMVLAAVSIANDFGVDPVVVGLTVVAIGTSLPELAASVVSAMRKEADLSVGNVLGSNLLNVLFVVGLTSMIRPLHVERVAVNVHLPIMLVFCGILLPFMWTKYRISRLEGLTLLAGFISYMVFVASDSI